MNRNTIVGLISLAAAHSAFAGTLGFLRPVGDFPASEPNVIVSVWDFGIDMEDPDFWLSTIFQAAALDSAYGFTNIRDELQPPQNPVEKADIFGTYFSTAQQFPNNTTFEGAPTYIFDFLSANSRLLSASWQSGSPADGIGPSIVLFRMTIARSAAAPALTATPNGPAIVSLSGQIFTNDFGGLDFDMGLYQVPEPSAALLMFAGFAAATGWRRRLA
jgi:hypothetical protein